MRPAFEPVYLSPAGLVCGAGVPGARFYHAAIRGDTEGMRPLTLPGGNVRFPTGIVPDSSLPEDSVLPEDSGGGYGPSRLRRLCTAALEQIRDMIAEAVTRWGRERIGVCVGSCDNGSEWSLAAHRAYFKDGAFPSGYELRFQGAAWPAEHIAQTFGLEGPVMGIATACASGAGALIKGAELIQAGICGAVIAGGVDVVSDTVFLGFNALEALSPDRCNPFSKNRKGINLGEGAAFFVLSREPLRADRERIVLCGAGESADAFHLTAPRPDGGGAIQAMEQALASAGRAARDIGYINLHGTGTAQNDAMEAAALAAVFGPAPPPASSTKPITGHTLGAAGALELALCRLVLRHGGKALPVHRWDGERDDALPALNFAGPGSAAPGIRFCMSNSFAFGGCNNSLIIGLADSPGGCP